MKTLLKYAALIFLELLPVGLVRKLLFLLRNNPALTDRWEYHIRPIHYYEPLPDFSAISETQITRRRAINSIDFNWPAQLRLLAEFKIKYCRELNELASQPEPYGFSFDNDYFAGLDAAVYYALIRHLKPSHVVEIGSGYSTRIAAKALARNQAEGKFGKLTCIEPYPQPRLLEAKLDIELLKEKVENIGLEFFTKLVPNDILFIDSSHSVKFNSDVCREFLEILPILKPGVWVHVHDIFLPHDYPAEFLINRRYAWNEQYLLEAFLSFNRVYTVQAANHWLALEYPDIVNGLAPQTVNNMNSAASFWLKRTT